MRYIINDDSLEEWFILLRKLQETKDFTILQYVIDEIEGEMLQHYTQEQIDLLFKGKK